MAVAVVQTAFIGDVVLATPLVEAARRSMPGERVVAVVRKGCENLLGNSPHVDTVLAWDKRGEGKGLAGMMAMAGRLGREGVSIALVPHRSIRTAAMARFSGAPVRVGFSKGGGAFLHSIRVPYPEGMHEVERNLELARVLGWETGGLRPALFPDARDAGRVDGVLGGGDAFCVLAPGSVWATKKWPVEHYIEAGRMFAGMGFRVIASGGPQDAAECAALADGVPGALDTCGEFTLRQSAELYRRAAFVLTGDTAPQHIAAAMGTMVFSLFGPTVRDFGFWPYTDRGVVLDLDGVTCRPCGIHGHRDCPEGHHRCMRDLTPSTVVREVELRL